MKTEERILSLSAVGLDAPGLVAQITRRVFRLTVDLSTPKK